MNTENAALYTIHKGPTKFGADLRLTFGIHCAVFVTNLCMLNLDRAINHNNERDISRQKKW